MCIPRETERQRQRRDFDCASVLQGREGTNEEASRCRRDVDKDGREGFLCYRVGAHCCLEHYQGFFRNWNRTLELSFSALVIVVVVLSHSDTL